MGNINYFLMQKYLDIERVNTNIWIYKERVNINIWIKIGSTQIFGYR